MKVDKTKKKGKKSKLGKEKKVKKVKKTSGFPEQVALTIEHDESNPNERYYVVHPIDFADINENVTVGIFRFRRAVDINVVRKIQRKPKGE